MLRGASLFCGAGGMDSGIESTGRMEVVLGVDLNPDVEPTWRANVKLGHRPDAFLRADVRDLRAEDLPQGLDFILGSTPCQMFSHANPDGDPDDPDMGYILVRSFLNIIRAYKPRWWAMENVPGLLPFIRRRDGWIPRLVILNSADYGTPQVRRRLFSGDYPLPKPTHAPIRGQTTLEGMRLEKWVSVREALNLAVARRSHSGRTKMGIADAEPAFSVGTQAGSGTSATTMFTPMNTLEQSDRKSKRRPRSLDKPARTVVGGNSGPYGGKTMTLLVSGFAHGKNAKAHSRMYPGDRPARVVGEDPDVLYVGNEVKSARKPSPHEARRNIAAFGSENIVQHPVDGPAPTVMRKSYMKAASVNAAAPDWALDPDAPAPTIFFGGRSTERTPQGGGAHPWSLWEERPATTIISEGRLLEPGHHDSLWLAVRRLTPMECAVLQGFPPEFRWIDPRPRRDGAPRRTLLYSMIGNAVPPQFGRAIGEAILQEADGGT